MSKTEYTPEQIAEFRAKDRRIVKQAILKQLIMKLDIEEVQEPEKVVFPLADRYVNYVYEEKETKTNLEDKKEVSISWVQIAEGLSLAIPDAINIKMLDMLSDEYNKAHTASLNPSGLLRFIMTKFGRYPTKQQNADKVLELYKQ